MRLPPRFALLALLAAPALAIAPHAFQAESYKVIAWNDLGMHCMDGDYSVFSILPPYNTLQAQVIAPSGDLLDDATGLALTYEAVPDPRGSENRSSKGKTNYWDFAGSLYGASTTPDVGISGFDMPGPANTPQDMRFDAKDSLFAAEGIPVTPIDDLGRQRSYPMFRLVLRATSTQQVLATTDVVAPVSSEMDCSLCHASDTEAAAQPSAGWVHDANFERDYRLNILRLHDEKQAQNPNYTSLLRTAGYSDQGLYSTVQVKKKPILCAKCHASNALPGTGLPGVSQLTHAIHGAHAKVIDPITKQSMDSSKNRASCYRCHPGDETRCLRGAMGGAVATDGSLAMQCQDCHGSMSQVGHPAREGWLGQPSCQNCHTGTATKNSGAIRYENAYDSGGKLRVAADPTFATNPDVPAPGFDLYRFSTGHGGLRCEACHGSTHAVYPSIHGNDNIQNEQLQGHAGTLVRCDACHKEMPEAKERGPHGLHPVGAKFARDHGDAVERFGRASCQACHGADYRGTVLSRSHSDQTFSTKYGTLRLFRGAQVSCYGCHDGPRSERASSNRPAVVQNANQTLSGASVQIPLVASDPDQDPLTLRVVQQPQHGRVALSGTTATYFPDENFAGVDRFTFAAWDGKVDSQLGTVSITRNAEAGEFGRGYPGTGGKTPRLSASTLPKIGSSAQLRLENSSGQASAFVLVLSGERRGIPTPFGGKLLLLPQILLTEGLAAQGATVPLPIPNQANLVGLRLGFQALQLDSGARFGMSFSNGLELAVGR